MADEGHQFARSSGGPGRGWMARRGLLPAGVAFVFLFGPWLALMAGVRSEATENRPAREFPGLNSGWHFFDGLSGYLTDRLPLRRQAVAVDARIDIKLFKEAPTFGQAASSQVLLGRAGWLFLADELARACTPPSDPVAAKANVARLTGALRRSGRKALFVIVPDKSTIAEEFLPKHDPLAQCAAMARERFWALLGNHPVPGFVDIRGVLRAEQKRLRSPIYLRSDTHWNSLGASLLVRRIVEQLPGDLWSGAVLEQVGQENHMGDLTILAGLPASDKRPTFVIRRPGGEAEMEEQPVGEAMRTVRRGGAPVFEGKTLFLYDSFGKIALPGMRQFFGDLTALPLFRSEPLKIAEEVRDWDLILIQVVERNFTFEFGQRFAGKAFFDLLERSAHLQATDAPS